MACSLQTWHCHLFTGWESGPAEYCTVHDNIGQTLLSNPARYFSKQAVQNGPCSLSPEQEVTFKHTPLPSPSSPLDPPCPFILIPPSSSLPLYLHSLLSSSPPHASPLHPSPFILVPLSSSLSLGTEQLTRSTRQMCGRFNAVTSCVTQLALLHSHSKES
jgi:hypothetical protein